MNRKPNTAYRFASIGLASKTLHTGGSRLRSARQESFGLGENDEDDVWKTYQSQYNTVSFADIAAAHANVSMLYCMVPFLEMSRPRLSRPGCCPHQCESPSDACLGGCQAARDSSPKNFEAQRSEIE